MQCAVCKNTSPTINLQQSIQEHSQFSSESICVLEAFGSHKSRHPFTAMTLGPRSKPGPSQRHAGFQVIDKERNTRTIWAREQE